MSEPASTIGIEEEYLVVDKKTRELVHEVPEQVMKACEARLASQVSPEFLRCQIEVGTGVCGSIAEARADLTNLRRTIIELTDEVGLAPIAVSTHPFARWRDQEHTNKDRYNVLAQDMQLVVRRMLICGMHVHLGIEDPDLRMDLMGQLIYFLPHFLALSTSSPFWEGEVSGLKCFRLSVFDEMPRTGLPAEFESYTQYERVVNVIKNAGLIEDASKIWWDLRPSARFPTLEMRITDICTRVEDGLAIAALYQCVTRSLYRLRRMNQRWRKYPHVMVEENRWLAQRYGFSNGLVDFGRGELVPGPELIQELTELVTEDARVLGTEAEMARVRKIAKEGTSSDRQLSIFNTKLAEGAEREEAFRCVVDHLIAETREDVVN